MDSHLEGNFSTEEATIVLISLRVSCSMNRGNDPIPNILLPHLLRCRTNQMPVPTFLLVRDRPFMTSTIIGATSLEQLKEDMDAFLTTERPLSPDVMADIETIFKRYKDPTIL
ncbi:putative NADP-dependent oxidoreductase domain superfamily [Helianthus annuus]|uniref:NADP-dependent oxidoreductase domain superfamily n=1 Tax=Helianthus annuus TaxID=4232 RepID=A0A9K3DRE6_HELAN|nr:putative NADP-dependent oxidoreductase domain superfamily [Helianthus annuus]